MSLLVWVRGVSVKDGGTPEQRALGRRIRSCARPPSLVLSVTVARIREIGKAWRSAGKNRHAQPAVAGLRVAVDQKSPGRLGRHRRFPDGADADSRKEPAGPFARPNRRWQNRRPGVQVGALALQAAAVVAGRLSARRRPWKA